MFYLFCRLKTVRHCLPVPGHSGPHKPRLKSQLVEESERRLSRRPCWRCSAVFWRSSAKPWQLCSTSLQIAARYFSTRSAWLLWSNTNLVCVDGIVIELCHVLNQIMCRRTKCWFLFCLCLFDRIWIWPNTEPCLCSASQLQRLIPMWPLRLEPYWPPSTWPWACWAR